MATATLSLKQVKNPAILSGLSLLLVILFLLSLSIGQVVIPVADILKILLNKTGLFVFKIDEVFEAVLWSIRLPRLVITILIGSALAVSGAALQGLFRNPLVEPGLIGVSSGSALGMVVLIVFGSSFIDPNSLVGHFVVPVIAFGGGLLATFLVMKISEQVGKTNIAVLVLGGVAINALAAALIGYVIFHADENQLRTFTFWTLGELGGATWEKLGVAAPILIFSTVWLLRFPNELNAIAVGEAEAFHMGVDVEKVKKLIIVFCALAVGVSVSLSGVIGFIGLVVPHLIRITFQADNRLILPASLLGGPILLIVADLIARTVVAPSELPIGVVTGLIGAPVFIILLIRAKANQELIIR